MKYSTYRIWTWLNQFGLLKYLLMFTKHEFLHYVDIILNLHRVLMGLWLCALFCPLWMWGFDPAIYISFFFSLYNAAFSACLNTYSMRYILACWISWSWKCCMECYNKVIFFYKLQLKWFVLFFMGIWWFDELFVPNSVWSSVYSLCYLCWPFCAHTLYCFYWLEEQ